MTPVTGESVRGRAGGDRGGPGGRELRPCSGAGARGLAGQGPWRRGGLRMSGPAREQAGPAQARIAAVASGVLVARRAGGVTARDVAQVVAVPADGGGLA